MNTEDGFLSQAHVAILGLGLMGGSLALALHGRCRTLSGIDPDLATRELAGRIGLVDQLYARPEGALEQADLLILAAPVGGILSLLDQLPNLHPGSPVVMDIGSTKQAVAHKMETLPERFQPIGGHPICGKEKGSLAEADALIYQGAPFVLSPLPRSTPHARRLAESLVYAAGSRPVWLEASEHDRLLAATSHLPYLLANALAAATPDEAAPLVGPGFRSTSRVGATPPAIMNDILFTNRENVLLALAAFRSRLDLLESLLSQAQSEQLYSTLTQGAEKQRRLVNPTGGPA
jgi:prephenate dehydrogenase